jgi:hypothetical protein
MKSERELKVLFNAPLHAKDTEWQTNGCRHTNPDICGSNGLKEICAFVREDGICRKPSAAWKKQYKKLFPMNE